MSEVQYTPETYNQVIINKSESLAVIDDLYAAYPTMTFDDKIIAMEIISNLKTINDEYDKYIIVYQMKAKDKNKKTSYTAIEGDTLPRIADKFTGDTGNWIKLYEYNNLNDTLLSAGDIILIPDNFN